VLFLLTSFSQRTSALSVVYWLVTALFAGASSYLTPRAPPTASGVSRFRKILRGCTLAVSGWLITVVLLTVWHLVIGVQRQPAQSSVALSPIGLFRILQVTSMLVVFVPVAEEVIFRRHLFDLVASYRGRAAALVVTTVLFGVAHLRGYQWQRVGDAMIIGLVAGALRVTTGGVLVPVAFHALNNGVYTVLRMALNLDWWS
jgi:uncharacterized protein